jgi:hypothetical protein
MVKPLEGYWTSKEFKLLKKDLIQHAEHFKEKLPNKKWNRPENETITAKEIVDNFMCKNARRFLEDYHYENRR